ncbi:MAG: FABP family protein [Lapillicoccus sp.]
MFELDSSELADLPERLRPLAWMIGRWEGAGVVGYPTIESVNFGQEIECGHDGRSFLEWHSHTWLLDQETGEKVRPLSTELGFWRPGEDGSEVELLLAHPTGIVELYYGTMEPARVTVRTDSVVRSPLAKEYNAGSRLYGLVESQLFWVMDMAAVGQELQSHVSAQLKRVG